MYRMTHCVVGGCTYVSLFIFAHRCLCPTPRTILIIAFPFRRGHELLSEYSHFDCHIDANLESADQFVILSLCSLSLSPASSLVQLWVGGVNYRIYDGQAQRAIDR